DLLLKVDHVGKQTSETHGRRISAMVEAVQEQERVADQGIQDLGGAFERLKVLSQQHRNGREREAKVKTLSAANGSTETEIRALAATLDELDAQCKAQDEEITIADEAHSATLAAIQSRKDERENLEKRLAIAGTSLEQCKTQMAEVQAVTEEKECAWKDETTMMEADMESVAEETQTLQLRLAELSDDIRRQVETQLATLEAEQATLAQAGPRLALELEEYKQVHPEVAEMKAQVKEKEQRCHILADQLAASQKVIDAHSVNQPEFDARKAEHKALSVSIAGVRSAGTDAAARKAALEDDLESTTLNKQAATTDMKDKIASLKQDGARIVAAKNEAATRVSAAHTTLAKAQNEVVSMQGVSDEASTALEKHHLVEQELQDETGKQDSVHDEHIARREHAAMEQREEAASIWQRVDTLKAEFQAATARAAEERTQREEAAKQALVAEAMARQIRAMAAEIEATYAEEIQRAQDE
ncbi:unnamed protein product, partial [Sphacelaria rigidula]